jgi:hypothetical protein
MASMIVFILVVFKRWQRNLHFRYQRRCQLHPGLCATMPFRPGIPGAGQQPVQWKYPPGIHRESCELQRKTKAEAEVVVAVVRRVVVPVRATAVLRVVEVAAATVHAVIALTAVNLSFLSLGVP